MLQKAALYCFRGFLKFMCATRLAPFKYEKSGGKYLHKLDPISLLPFYVHFTYMGTMNIFCCVRLLLSLGQKFPLMVRILQLIWSGAYTFTNILLLQYIILGSEMLQFLNAILDCLDKTEENERRDETHPSYSGLSIAVYICTILIFTNPLLHSLMIAAEPCTPHFLTSVIADCENGRLTPGYSLPRSITIGFVILETYTVMIALYTWTFNWFIMSFGLAWIRNQLKEMRYGMKTVWKGALMSVMYQYRSSQVTVGRLNKCVEFYLRAFPTILFTVLGLQLFGTIRLWHLDPRGNIFFPTCALRCGYEAMSQIGWAGKVNAECKALLWDWKEKGVRGNKMQEKFKRSCPILHCAAGDMYTFENSILIVCLDNVVQLSCNLLLTIN